MLKVVKTENILGMELSAYGDVENPLFLAKDIARVIEHSNSRMMIENLEDESEKVVNIAYTHGGSQESWFLTEDGVYEVLMTSRKPIAKEFRKGFKEFLKAWRKGSVKVVSVKDSLLLSIMKSSTDLDRAIAVGKYEAEYVVPLENTIKEQVKEIEHKEDVIIALVSDIDLATKRQRISQVVRNNTKNFKDRYALLYREFELKYHIDLNRRMRSDKIIEMKPRIKSKMDLIDRELGMIQELYEIACVVFETDMQEIIKRFER
jgi:prophage antirepressor-like protein